MAFRPRHSGEFRRRAVASRLRHDRQLHAFVRQPCAYGAGYYSYKWAEVLDADAFTRFRREGIFNSETGASTGSIFWSAAIVKILPLYRNFMGRDPDANALLERLGLLTAH